MLEVAVGAGLSVAGKDYKNRDSEYKEFLDIRTELGSGRLMEDVRFEDLTFQV